MSVATYYLQAVSQGETPLISGVDLNDGCIQTGVVTDSAFNNIVFDRSTDSTIDCGLATDITDRFSRYFDSAKYSVKSGQETFNIKVESTTEPSLAPYLFIYWVQPSDVSSPEPSPIPATPVTKTGTALDAVSSNATSTPVVAVSNSATSTAVDFVSSPALRRVLLQTSPPAP